METYYSIRTVKAKSLDEAIAKMEAGKFDEQDALCDKVLTGAELLKQIPYTRPVCEWVVKVKDIPKHKNNSYVGKDGYLKFDNKTVCYTRGIALRKARLFDGKIEKLTVKFNKNKHIII